MRLESATTLPSATSGRAPRVLLPVLSLLLLLSGARCGALANA
jgi:hypothetical protein